MYLKMKMPRLKGVITVGSSIEHSFNYDVECVEHAKALALDESLIADMEKLANEGPDSPVKHVGNFEAAKQTKEVPLDPAAPGGKLLRVSSTLDPKIGRGACRLSPHQCIHLYVEPLGHAGHPEGGHRALP
jgi:hypothetical protein